MKKKIIYLLIFIFVFSSLGCNNNETDKVNGNIDEEEILQEYFFPKELNYTGLYAGDYLVDKFYPIGWSKEGHFAFITEYADEGIGGYMFKIDVINLINDQVEWSWESEPDDDNYREEIWKDNYKTIKTELNKYGIIQKRNMEIGNVFFNYKGKEFNIKLKTETEVDRDYGFDVIVGTKIYLNSPQLGNKKVYEYKETDYSMILSQLIAGYIMSPYEDRILIILKNERWGWEGVPSVVYFELTGANLTTGFQPETN